MSDSLESLPDAKLSEVFAVEVAEDYAPAPLEKGDRKSGIEARFVGKTIHRVGSQPRTPTGIRWKDGGYGGTWRPYATSADAVLPYLMIHEWDCDAIDRVPTVRIWDEDGADNEATAPTFPRAACIALIRAKRAQKGGA